ncbi:MAG TPA: hypothetical protein VLB83_05335 [Candidatus Paceibacterota bacterium]|nr:hypothetical protein [Candidatus Paceibacterota bacterium]
MIRDILRDIFSPYSLFGDRCLAALMALLMLAAVGLVVLLGFVLVDSVGITPTKTATTVVEAKQVVPAHTTTILVGKVIVPQHRPESYRLHFKIDGEELSPTVEKKFFDDVRVGDRIEVDYGFGRLSNSHQPTQIRLMAR